MIALAALAVLVAVCDARSRRIPNKLVAAVVACGVTLQAARLFAPWVLDALPLARALSRGLGTPLSCLAWGMGVASVGTVLELSLRRFGGRPGMGLGDVKYVAAWACVLGVVAIPALAFACLLGAAWAIACGARDFALGPWLSLAFVGAMVIVAA